MKKEKMAWIPAIVASRKNNCCRTRGGGAIAGAVAILVVFGLLFFIVFNRTGRFMFPMWMMVSGLAIFLIIIVGISVIAASMSESYKKPKEKIFRPLPSQNNPYKVISLTQKQTERPISKELVREIPVIEDIRETREKEDVKEVNFCQLCGAKRDRDAIFCHQCGNKF
ncbi:MAG: hypothetical protein ACXABO_17010 [Promethearchaeota archaeon]